MSYHSSTRFVHRSIHNIDLTDCRSGIQRYLIAGLEKWNKYILSHHSEIQKLKGKYVKRWFRVLRDKSPFQIVSHVGVSRSKLGREVNHMI